MAIIYKEKKTAIKYFTNYLKLICNFFRLVSDILTCDKDLGFHKLMYHHHSVILRIPGSTTLSFTLYYTIPTLKKPEKDVL